MAEITPEQMRAAAVSLRTQSDEMDAAKTAIHLQEAALKAERHEINLRQNDLNLAATALEYKAGEQERGGPAGTPSDAVSALIEGALASAEGVPESAVISG